MTCLPHHPGIILLWNRKPNWTKTDLREAVEAHQPVIDALRLKFSVVDVCLGDTVEESLRGFTPSEWIVMNWCDGFANRQSTYTDVIEQVEHLGYLHLGSDARTLRLSWNKAKVRGLLSSAGIPVPPGFVTKTAKGLKWSRFPAIVKPSNQHASIGITRDSVVENSDQLGRQVQYVLDMFEAPALVESFIQGREFTITIVGNHDPKVLPPVELDYGTVPDIHNRIYSYESKFIFGIPEPQFICPAILEQSVRSAIQSSCLKAYQALNCLDYARIDIRLSASKPYLIDLNPNPDISTESEVELSAQVAGLDYASLIDQLVRFALKRQRKVS